MSKQEINKYLTEKVFGECRHSMHKVNGLYNCSKCMEVGMQELTFLDFFSSEGCMKLWLKIQEMEWFDEFIYCQPFALLEGYYPVFGLAELIHPDRLAPAVYEFLKTREE